MERLDLSETPENPEIEAAIHLARYANILPFVKGKTVLDAACGEGYGSALLMKAGAKRVVGVDVSSAAIEKARVTFAESGAEYVCADVSELESKFEADTFDVIVSIETIEHVPDHDEFLSSLKVLGKESAIIYITCPNDHWYYPTDDQRNPYHLRKYSFEDFETVGTRTLGENVKWGLGGPVFGFGTVSRQINVADNQLHKSWMHMEASLPGFSVANRNLSPITEKNCSYYAGIWNLPGEAQWASSEFSVSMDAYSKMYLALINENPADKTLYNLKNQIEELSLRNQQINDVHRSLQREMRNKGLLLSAAQAENEALRNNLYRVQAQLTAIEAGQSDLQSKLTVAQTENDRMYTGYWRYVRMSQWLPAPLRKVAVKTVRYIKQNSKKEVW